MRLFKRCACPNQGTCKHKYQYEFVLKGDQHRHSTNTANLRDAERIVTKAHADAVNEDKGIAPPKRTRLSALIAAYLPHTAKRNATAYKDKAVLERLLAVIGDLYLDQITAKHIEAWMTERMGEVSASTVDRESHNVSGLFSRAVAWELLRKHPMEKVAKLTYDDVKVRWFETDELATVLAIPNPFIVQVGRVTLETLSRLSEVLNIHRTDIRKAAIGFRQKGGKVNIKPVTPEMRAMLLARVHPVSGYVFGEGELGKPPTQQNSTKRFERAFARAGILDASHHTFRHTGVTIMLEQGRNPKMIQKLAGWSTMRMLERYGHASDAEGVAAVTGVSSYLKDIPLSPAGGPLKNAHTT